MKSYKELLFLCVFALGNARHLLASEDAKSAPDGSGSPKKSGWTSWFHPSSYNPVRGVNEAAQKIASDVATTAAGLAPVLAEVDSLLAPAVKPDGSELVVLSDLTGDQADANVPVTVLGAVVDGVTKARVEQVNDLAKERLEQIDGMLCKYAKYGAAAVIVGFIVYLCM